jgi:hypothetical protein
MSRLSYLAWDVNGCLTWRSAQRVRSLNYLVHNKNVSLFPSPSQIGLSDLGPCLTLLRTGFALERQPESSIRQVPERS